MKCRFEICELPAVAEFEFDRGCICYEDKVQALCPQHIIQSTPLGSMKLKTILEPEHWWVKEHLAVKGEKIDYSA